MSVTLDAALVRKHQRQCKIKKCVICGTHTNLNSEKFIVLNKK
jgi:hypothetical protein